MAATKKSSKAAKKQTPAVTTPKFSDLPRDDPRVTGLLRNVDNFLERETAGLTAAGAKVKKEVAKERRGIALRGDRLEGARRAATDMGMAAISIRYMAVAAVDDREHGEWFATGIENTAKVIARKADVLLAYLGERYGLGHFADELEPAAVYQQEGQQ